MKYYLINGKIMKGGEMPKRDNYGLTSAFEASYNKWLSSLQPCEIDESELENVKNKVYTFDNCKADNPIEITDIVRVKEIRTETKSGGWTDYKIYFKQPKAKEDSDAVLIQAIKSVLYESAKKTEIPEGGFELSVQFEEQAKELIKRFNISLRNI